MGMLPSPLLRRRSLLPGESLPSLLLRLAQVNHYDSLSFVLGLAFAQTAEKDYYTDISRALSPIILQRLVALTKLDALTLYSSTYHSFAPIITPPEIATGSLELANGTLVPLCTGKFAQHQLRPEFAVQFCPECLRSAVYHRLIWTPVAVAVCLHHNCLLVNRCPQCDQLVKVKDILELYCSKCRTSLTEAQPIQIQDDEFGLFTQLIIQSWFNGNNIVHSDRYLLPERPVRTLYRFIDGLRKALMLMKPDWPYFHHLSMKMAATRSTSEMKTQALTPYQSYCLYATALKAIISWPQGFFDFLDAYKGQLNKSKHHVRAVGYDLGTIYTWLEKYWHHPSFAFVQEAFNDYFVHTYGLTHAVVKSGRYRNNQIIIERINYISVADAAKLLRTDAPMIKLLVDDGRLTKYESQDVHKHLRLDRAEVLALQVIWLDSITLKQAAALIGISVKMIPGMVKEGLLTVELSRTDWRVSKSSLTSFMDKLGEKCQDIDKKIPSMVDSTVASRMYARKSGLDLSHLLFLVLKRNLSVYKERNQTLRIRNLLFVRSDIDACLARFYADKGLIHKKDVLKLLGTHEKNLSRWVNSGLLKMSKYNFSYVFDKKEVEGFLTNYVRSKAAADILSVRKNDVNILAQTGILQAVSGPNIDGYSCYIFSRETLLRWKSQWLTGKEAANMLGIEIRTLVALARRGRIETCRPEPLRNTLIWYSNQSVLTLQEKLNAIDPSFTGKLCQISQIDKLWISCEGQK